MRKYGGYDDEPFIAELYDLIPTYAERPDAAFFISYSQASDRPTLELGCGTGRILIPTAQSGCRIVGLDLSTRMLARCRQKLSMESRDVQDRTELVQANMADFTLEKAGFGLVTTPFRSFQHLLATEDQIECLYCANKHLSMDGMLILDLFQPDLAYLSAPCGKPAKNDFTDTLLSDKRIISRKSRLLHIHQAEQYFEVEMNYLIRYPNGREENLVQTFPMRYFFRYEIEHLLARCGFDLMDLFGNYDKTPLVDDSPEMICVAQKIREV